jgi:hypothetical protein
VFSECQLLCNARANDCCVHSNRRFTSDLPFSYSVSRAPLVPFLGCNSPDLGTRFFPFVTGLTSEQRALVRCALFGNLQIYLAGDPESGGHPIGRRSTALEGRFRLRCRSWSSAR